MFGKQSTKKVILRPHNLEGEGFDLLVVDGVGEKKLDLISFWSDSTSILESSLRSVIKEYDLKNNHATIVLPHSAYSHFTINKPNVPQEEIRDSLFWASQEKLDSLPYFSPILDSCFAPSSLKGRESNKMHVFVAEESHIRNCVNSVRKSGLKVDSVTVHEVAASSLLANWSSGVLLAYLDIPNDSSPSLILVLDGYFVAYKKLPSINTNSAVDVQRDQFSLFFAEIARQLTYFSNCVDENYSAKIYGSGENWHNLRNNNLFKSVFAERFPSQQLGTLDLSQVVNTEGVDSNMLRDMQHDLLGGALSYEQQ